jgi:hypothetical protein
VARLDSIPLFTGVSLPRRQEEIPEMPTTSEVEPEARLTQGLNCRSNKIDQFIYDHLTNFLDTHTIIIDSSEHAVEEHMNCSGSHKVNVFPYT